MTSQSLSLSIPAKWQERFVLKRIDEEEIELSLEERNAILAALEKGARFIQIRKYTLMVNAIKSIEPKWGEDNIPSRPKEQYVTEFIGDGAKQTLVNEGEIREWDRVFGDTKA